MSREELVAQGFVESYIDDNAQEQWRATKLGMDHCALGGEHMQAIIEAIT